MAFDQEAASNRRDRSIVVACKCGASLEAGAADAGARLNCPNCGSFVVIPPLSSFPSSPFPLQAASSILKLPVNRRFQFSVQTLLLMVCVVGLLLALIVQLQVRAPEDDLGPIDYSWTTGTMSVRAEARPEGGHYVIADGNWAGVNPDFMIRYSIWLTSRRGKTVFVVGTSLKLNSAHDITGYDPPASPFGGEPFRVECDYEIWTGATGKSELLAKNSVFSPWYDK